MHRGYLLLALVSGFLAVSFGAFGSHGLKNMVSAELIAVFNVAVDYQFYHTLALMLLALSGQWVRSRLLDWAAYCFIAGMVLFSGSLYLYVFMGQKWLGMITPVGGVSLMLGWLMFAIAALRSKPATD